MANLDELINEYNQKWEENRKLSMSSKDVSNSTYLYCGIVKGLELAVLKFKHPVK